MSTADKITARGYIRHYAETRHLCDGKRPHERGQGRRVCDVHEGLLGYDITGFDVNSSELPAQRKEPDMESRSNNSNSSRANHRTAACHYNLADVLTHYDTMPVLREPIKDPARFDWHEVTKVAHYWLEVDAISQTMQVREKSPGYGGQR